MASSSTKATQEFVPIKEVRDGIVITKDGTMCSVLMASSINFSLKSLDEQQAILMQYQNFLNSLDFSIQFFVQSRQVNIEPYLTILKEAAQKQTNDLLAIQTREYTEFVRSLVSAKNIIAKTFYVIIPYKSSEIQITKAGLLRGVGLFGGNGKKQQQVKEEKEDAFIRNQFQLEQRVNIVQTGISRCGVRTTLLNTEEVIELFYKMFNPGDVNVESIKGMAQ